MLRLCAFLSPDAIPEEIITQGAVHLGPVLEPVAGDPIALDDAIATLSAYSLVHRFAKDRTLSLHRLVQAVLLDTMSPEENQQWIERTTQALNLVFPNVTYDTWANCQLLLPHAQACLSWLERSNLTVPDVAGLFARMGLYLREQGQYAEAEASVRHALMLEEHLLGPQHLDTAQTLNILGGVYFRLGKYQEAEPLFQRAVAIREEQLGPTHPNVALGLHNLALIYEKQSKYQEAEPLYQRALAICEEKLGDKHPTTLTVKRNYTTMGLFHGSNRSSE